MSSDTTLHHGRLSVPTASLSQLTSAHCCAALCCAVQVMDTNKDGYITFDEFAKWWSSRKAPSAAGVKQTAKV
jgi:hypothetical protein